MFSEELAPDPEEEVAALTSVLGRKPSAEEVARLNEAMRGLGLDSRAAALHLGLLPTDPAAPSPASPSPDPAEGPNDELKSSLVQIALRKLSSSRALVVKEGVKVRPGKDIPFAADPYSPHSENIRALRTELLLRCPPSRTANVIALVSPESGEGRSQLAAELAIAFAQLGSRTLLVDADLRNPRQHQLFDCNNDEGLSQGIERQDLPSLHPVEDLPHMQVLTAGPVPPNPLELLSDGRFGKWMTRWRDRYQFVIIDTPPITRCSDGLALAAIAGRALVLTRAKHTSYKHAKDMMRRLATSQAEIVGAVIGNY
ncbi:MAG TPA: CpsD/CapB family tyrosine-protein kinase [Steroidobacteraceae bacterium]|nr:CpsD/CapB family tyrosine-protein kinase [Steroidobacteraceae bacterium]